MRLRRTILICLAAVGLLATAGAVAPSAGAAPPVYQLEFYHSHKCIDDPHSSSDNVVLIQYTCNGDANQLWEELPVTEHPGYVYYKNIASGKCMNVKGNGTANNTYIIQYPCSTSYVNEQFYTSLSPVTHYVYLEPRSALSKAINVYKAGKNNGSTIRLYTRCACTNEYILKK